MFQTEVERTIIELKNYLFFINMAKMSMDSTNSMFWQKLRCLKQVRMGIKSLKCNPAYLYSPVPDNVSLKEGNFWLLHRCTSSMPGRYWINSCLIVTWPYFPLEENNTHKSYENITTVPIQFLNFISLKHFKCILIYTDLPQLTMGFCPDNPISWKYCKLKWI